MSSDKELNKKSDEHKALLAQKCVDLFMRKTGSQEEISEVRVSTYTGTCMHNLMNLHTCVQYNVVAVTYLSNFNLFAY